ncbi:DUF6418 domain-containing protein [Granulosicoccaceae sp. 1_MG-2023]|nr:DUF6418 domain-containing protein [Granulosicoccaceae sp. 1_MG-2023]
MAGKSNLLRTGLITLLVMSVVHVYGLAYPFTYEPYVLTLVWGLYMVYMYIKYPVFGVLAIKGAFFSVTCALAVMFLNVDRVYLVELDSYNSVVDSGSAYLFLLSQLVFYSALFYMLALVCDENKFYFKGFGEGRTVHFLILAVLMLLELYVFYEVYLHYGPAVANGVDRFHYRAQILPRYISQLHNLALYLQPFLYMLLVKRAFPSAVLIYFLVVLFLVNTVGTGEKFGMMFTCLNFFLIVYVLAKRLRGDQVRSKAYPILAIGFGVLLVAAAIINFMIFPELEKGTYYCVRLLQQGQLWNEAYNLYTQGLGYNSHYSSDSYSFHRIYSLMHEMVPSDWMSGIVENNRVYNGSTQATLLLEGGVLWMLFMHIVLAVYFSGALTLLLAGVRMNSVIILIFGARMVFNFALMYQLSLYDKLYTIETGFFAVVLVSLLVFSRSQARYRSEHLAGDI